MQRSDIYSHFFDLHSVHFQNSNNQLLVNIGQHYGRKIFRFFCRATSRSSVCFFWRSASRFGPSCSSSFTASLVASSAFVFYPLHKKTKPKTSLKEKTTKITGNCQTSPKTTGVLFVFKIG